VANREQFKRFLVVSPLIVSSSSSSSSSPVDDNDPNKSYKVPYGSYYQLYRLDGKLIAVRKTGGRSSRSLIVAAVGGGGKGGGGGEWNCGVCSISH